MNLSGLKQWKKKGNEIILYCAGLHGIEFKSLLDMCGIKIDYFCDNADDKENQIIDGTLCVKPQTVVGHKNYCVIICAGYENYASIYGQAVFQGLNNICDFRKILDSVISDKRLFFEVIAKRYESAPVDLFYTNVVKKSFLEAKVVDLTGQRIAVYTSCFGGYDDIRQPMCFPENVDYYYVADEEPKENIKYHWIDAKTIIPDRITDPIKRNRYVKMHAHKIFPEYRYSIYVDANIQIMDDITSFICKSRSGISVFMHSRRDCLYYEAMTIVNHKRVIPDDVISQMSRYLDEGMPLHFGLTEMPVIAREHHNENCIRIMNEWWKEFENESQRDQLSFMYALWRNDMDIHDLAILGDDVRHHNKLYFNSHFKDSKSVKNERII